MRDPTDVKSLHTVEQCRALGTGSALVCGQGQVRRCGRLGGGRI